VGALSDGLQEAVGLLLLRRERLSRLPRTPPAPPCTRTRPGHAYVVATDGKVTDLGQVSFDEDQKGTVTLPETVAGGKKIRIAVVFDDTPLVWDSATVRATATEH
jgi:hypothetical protein